MAAVTIEYGYVDFDGTQDYMTVSLSEGFQHAPKVTVTPIDKAVGEVPRTDCGNVNVFIDSVTNSSFTIQASNKFIGRVQYQALLTE